ncbi:streptophobe family protein [Streptomyces gamaensis]|uniref:Streptophobe family protein n=1 Tax=Streptomyces gamaensis TaxID=1763542 RepID=A0ABW0YYK2_9ACTN
MTEPPRAAPAAHRAALLSVRLWWDALAAVLAGLAAMAVCAALGLWAAGAGELPGGSFVPVVAAAMVAAVGGTLEVTGGAGVLGRTGGEVGVVPLSVTLSGALATAVVFLLPLRHRAVAGGAELAGRVVRTALLWLLALLLVSSAARHSFRLDLGDQVLNGIGEALGSTPTVGFRAATASTLGVGLLWLLVLLAVATACSRRTALPSRLLRFQDVVRPVAFASVVLLLGYVALGLVVGLVVAVGHEEPGRTAAVLLLGLPNLAWIALGVGLGGAWEGQAPRSIGLPMPEALAAVLRENDGSAPAVTVSSLAQHDGRAWLLVVLAALALLAAGFLAAVRSPAGTRPWQHALRLAVALALTLLVIGLLTRIEARFGLSLLGIGDLGGFGGEVRLSARLLPLVGVGLVWGLVAGFAGSLLAVRVRRRGDVAQLPEPKVPG